MPDGIERYVRNLSACIGDRLAPSVKVARLREAEGHLRMAAEEVGVEAAIRNYGAPRVVAGELVRVERGYVGTSSGRLALGVSFLLGITLVLQLNRYDLGFPPSIAGHLIWMPAFGMAFFAFRAGQTRRWLALSFLPVFGIVWIATLVIAATHGSIKPLDLRSAERYLAVVRKEEAVLNQWKATGSTPSDLIPMPTYVMDKAEIPLLPFLVPNGSRISYSLISPSLANDFGGWKQYGSGWAKELPTRVAEAQTVVGYIRSSPLQRILYGFTPSRLLTAFTFLFDDILLIVLVNAVALGMAALSDRRPLRKA